MTERAAKPVPATNRINGPKRMAAVAPTKCSPRTDDSDPDVSRGYVPMRRTRRSSDGARNGIRATSGAYPVASSA